LSVPEVDLSGVYQRYLPVQKNMMDIKMPCRGGQRGDGALSSLGSILQPNYIIQSSTSHALMPYCPMAISKLSRWSGEMMRPVLGWKSFRKDHELLEVDAEMEW
jgi:hypothetical protein